MPNIDLATILESTISVGHGDLVTRRTGRVVRGGVEELISTADDGQVHVIDFGAVRCLDISCADEIVGKLLLQYGHGQYFVLTGVTEAHCDAIDVVLERHEMAVVARDREDKVQVLGPLDETVKRAFGAVIQSEVAAEADVADRLAVSTEAARPLLQELLTRHLVTLESDMYRALSA